MISVTPKLAPDIEAATQHTSSKILFSEKQVITFMIFLSVVLFVLIIYVIIDNRNGNKLWNGSRGCRRKQSLSDLICPVIYHFLSEFPFTRSYIEKLAYRYRLISPCDNTVIAKRTVLVCAISWSISILTFLMVFLSNPRLNTLMNVTVAIIMINSEVVGRTAKIFEIKILEEIQKLLEYIVHNFYVEYRVDDALYRSRDSLSRNMKYASDQIYKLLLSDKKEESLKEYYENIPNKYLRALVSLCIGVMERGDQIVNGQYLFIRNLENLQREIEIELDKLKRLRLEFLGVILCVITPVFCIDFVKKFSINIKENMDGFYYGKQGFLIDICLLTITYGIYIVLQKSAEYASFHQSKHRFLFWLDRISWIKKAMDNYCDKFAGRIQRLKRELRNNGYLIRTRHFILRSYLLSVIVFIMSIGTMNYLHYLSKEQLITVRASDMGLLTSAAKENQYVKMAEVIHTYVEEYADTNKKTTKAIPDHTKEISHVLKQKEGFSNDLINEAMAEEILRRVHQYQKEYFSFLDLLLCIVLSVTAHYIPELLLGYNAAVSKAAMEDEVNQFNALINMYMYMEGMTVKQLLEELESFAVVFKQSLQFCINNLSAGEQKALLDLKDREPYEPFNRIVDNLLRCDEIPLYQAFHEVDIVRDGYLTKRKYANEKSIRNRALRAYVLAAIPFLLLFSYGLVPTLVTSMNEINETISELENGFL